VGVYGEKGHLSGREKSMGEKDTRKNSLFDGRGEVLIVRGFLEFSKGGSLS